MRWTPERIDIMRTLAATGAPMSKAAAMCEVSVGTIACIASKNRIRFGRSKPAIAAPESRQFAEAAQKMAMADRDAARARLIAAIMAEARR
jgi:hypothetical protein